MFPRQPKQILALLCRFIYSYKWTTITISTRVHVKNIAVCTMLASEDMATRWKTFTK